MWVVTSIDTIDDKKIYWKRWSIIDPTNWTIDPTKAARFIDQENCDYIRGQLLRTDTFAEELKK